MDLDNFGVLYFHISK